jgi:hypothetical protein
MQIRVECGSERSAAPRRFILGDRVVDVDDVLDRWYGDEADYFRVRGTDGHLYVLKHMRDDEAWELTSFTRHGSRGTAVGEPAPRILH